MNKSLPIVGRWWLPDNHRKRIDGILYKDDLHGLCLELNGYLLEYEKINDTFGIPLTFIFGKTKAEEEITLKDSVLISLPGTSSIYQIYSCFLGKHFRKLNDVRLDVVNVSFNHLNKWVFNHFFDDDFNKILSESRASIVVQIEPINLGVISDFHLKIKIDNIKMINEKDIAGFKFNSVLEISSEKPRLFNEFLEVSIKFSKFLGFALLKPTFIIGMGGVIKHARKRYENIDIILRFKEKTFDGFESRR